MLSLFPDVPGPQTITLFARSVAPYSNPLAGPVPVPATGCTTPTPPSSADRPWLVYLEGGPGFGNREPQDNPLTQLALKQGYQVLYLDYRGTGLSSPVSHEALQQKVGDIVDAQAHYLRLFRQDSIVRDLECVRLCLTAGEKPDRQQWSIFGQSFGGFVSLTYLSFAPEVSPGSWCWD